MSTDFVSDCDCFLPEISPGTEYIPSAADVFGPGSRIADISADITTPQFFGKVSFVDFVQYDVLVCAVLVLLFYILYNYRESIELLFTVLIKKKISSDKLLEEQNYFFRQFIAVTLVLGALIVAGTVTKIGDIYGGFRYLNTMAPMLSSWVCWIIVIVAVLVSFYKWAFVELLGFITGDKEFFKEHHTMSRFFFVETVIFVSPLFLLLSFSYGKFADIVLFVTLGIALAMCLIFLFKSYKFFKVRNVSTLQWILYLCGVEVFPLSFILLFGLRHV